MDDASLDEFLTDEREDDGDDAATAPTTSRWDGDGVRCAECGESVERLWQSPDGFVCATCKEW